MERVFLAFRIAAPWPVDFPSGRVLAEEMRHLTVFFLGEQEAQQILALIPLLPAWPLPIAPGGYFDQCLTLPPSHPRVVAWHANFGEETFQIHQYMEALRQFFLVHGIACA